jgi:hypothetical protein
MRRFMQLIILLNIPIIIFHLDQQFFPNTKSAGAPNPDGYVYVYGVVAAM